MNPILLFGQSVEEGIRRLVYMIQTHPGATEVKTRGRTSLELSNVVLHIHNPRRRWAVIGERTAPPVHRILGRTIWELCGRNDVDSIRVYDSMASKFSDESGLVPAAYGYRMMKQIPRLIRHLQENPASRRAVVCVLDSTDDYHTVMEFPCMIALHMMIRNGVLNCTCYMRSQSAISLLDQDIFIFTILQEYVAAHLDLELGTYTHMIGSAHIFAGQTCNPHIMPSEWSSLEEHVFKGLTTEQLKLFRMQLHTFELAIQHGSVSEEAVNEWTQEHANLVWNKWLRYLLDFHVPGSVVSDLTPPYTFYQS